MSYGILIPGTPVYYMGLYAARMVDSALASQALKDYRNAQNSNYFINAPTNDIGAYFKSAYWLAVASRLSGNLDWASAARTNLIKGEALAAFPLTDQMTGRTKDILSAAAGRLNSADRNVVAVRALLLGQASFGVDDQTRAKADRSVLYNTLIASSHDVADTAQLARSLATGKKPPGKTDWEWWWQKNKWYAGGALLAIGVGGYIFRPYVQAYNKKSGGD
jgi:hypothetical protein